MAEKIKVIGLDFVNAFLISVKDGFILIDTGLARQWEKLEKELTTSGCVPGTLKLVVITHGDMDHLGNCAKLQTKYGTKIAIHRADADMAEKGALLKRKTRTLAGRIFMIYRRTLMKILGIKMSFDKFTPDIFLTDGQNLSEYGFDAKIIHLPGHTRGSIGILTAGGDLFAGDALVNTKKPGIAMYIENSRELTSSLEKLGRMNIKTVYPGHGAPFALDPGILRY